MSEHSDTDDPTEGGAFVAEFRRWREVRGLSRTALAMLMRYSRSYVSKVESGDEPGSADFAHEIDHLHGTLCRDHLPSGRHPIPVEQYQGTGNTWHYPTTTRAH
ncbi:helix-turn-helix domain-containing protein [Haloactinomyces albus]|uniref:Ribosome-binding protein aMBF1 (Putative translation factor) n=1 Tax=Haloactinomyces albus TaxID=1352928 RepID=A0AAE3ZHT8_9ACTN|nr:helix-turn-helix transcriptional regulator [Haloactinomyces albus]MDR7303863.1 ribosome-binding protein aMBF1 (putative translation factor) [Haloactinomyces albus]